MSFINTESDFIKLVKVSDSKKLDLINYASNDFISARASLIEYIKAVYPLTYNNFIESDLGMVLIEMVAYMAAVTSMKADMLANENILRTAKNRDSVKKLLENIGISLKGPLSSACNAKLTLPEVSPDPSFPLTIKAAQRTVTITSPEDGGSLTFTVYKVVDGFIDDLTNERSDIDLYATESLDGSGLVFNNLALLEGTLVRETGSLTTVNSVKSIALLESPVIENSVQVYITDNSVGTAWKKVDNLFFASGASDKIFQTSYGENYRSTVFFGDGITGEVPPNGSTYTITYRVGGGTRGNIKNELINTPITLTTDPFAYTVAGTLENTSLATGGLEAETVAHAKKYGPLTFKQQNRLVTLEDFTSYVNSYVSPLSETAKGTAVTRKAFGSANIVDLFVLQKASATQLQKATPSYKKSLLLDIDEVKLFCVDVVVVDGLVRTLDVITTIRVLRNLVGREEEIKQKVKEVVTQYFSIDSLDFGEPLIVADLNRVIIDLPEVMYSTIDNLDQVISIDYNEIVQLNNLEINVEYI